MHWCYNQPVIRVRIFKVMYNCNMANNAVGTAFTLPPWWMANASIFHVVHDTPDPKFQTVFKVSIIIHIHSMSQNNYISIIIIGK